MPKAFEDAAGEPIVKRIEQEPDGEQPQLLAPIMLRTEKGNEIIDLLNDQVFYVNVTLFDESASETTVRLLALDDNDQTLEGGGGGGGGSAPDPFPFEVTVTNQSSPSTDADVTVYPGTFDGIVASNYNSTFVVPQSGDRYLVATLTFSSGAVTGVTYSMETTAPSATAVAKDAPPTSLEVLLAIISDGEGFNVENSSLNFTASLRYQVEKVSAVGPGESPFEYYYAWTWS